MSQMPPPRRLLKKEPGRPQSASQPDSIKSAVSQSGLPGAANLPIADASATPAIAAGAHHISPARPVTGESDGSAVAPRTAVPVRTRPAAVLRPGPAMVQNGPPNPRVIERDDPAASAAANTRDTADPPIADTPAPVAVAARADHKSPPRPVALKAAGAAAVAARPAVPVGPRPAAVPRPGPAMIQNRSPHPRVAVDAVRLGRRCRQARGDDHCPDTEHRREKCSNFWKSFHVDPPVFPLVRFNHATHAHRARGLNPNF